ncbi:MAG TPA: DUF504 domain-containing protein [Usitatibacter sp.]|nr:DUF504 domain-containing protein [Usitatibacter sp.]
MIPIHELLARIRWDPEFGRGRFEIGYLDHRRGALVRLPLDRIEVHPEERFSFEAFEDDGTVHTVPYHRVREVRRDGEVIWQRPSRAPARKRRGAG